MCFVRCVKSIIRTVYKNPNKELSEFYLKFIDFMHTLLYLLIMTDVNHGVSGLVGIMYSGLGRFILPQNVLKIQLIYKLNILDFYLNHELVQHQQKSSVRMIEHPFFCTYNDITYRKPNRPKHVDL